jgi:hypothetical protein
MLNYFFITFTDFFFFFFNGVMVNCMVNLSTLMHLFLCKILHNRLSQKYSQID